MNWFSFSGLRQLIDDMLPSTSKQTARQPLAARETYNVDGKPLSKMLVADLRAALQSRNLPITGKKDELIQRLKEYLSGYGSSSAPPPNLENIDCAVVLMVAEKPMMARQIADILAKGRRMSYRRAPNNACAISEYDGQFMGRPARFKVTSTCGHVMKADFPQQFQDRRIEPIELYGCPIVKVEASPDLKMNKFLAEEAQGCDFLVLWLDCDLEGENICFEVMNAVRRPMEKNSRIGGAFMDRVFRARFSSLLDIESSMDRLIKPNQRQALSVDAKKELDLRIGISMSRFLTGFLRKHNRDRDVKMVTYGPCQTPTLAFCVEQHEKVEQFQADHYYSISCEVKIPQVNKKLKIDYDKGPMRNEQECRTLVEKSKMGLKAKLIEAQPKVHEKSQPKAMNTVELLKAASSKLGMSPQDAMKTAENLYMKGYISYPRTETTAYPQGFDFKGHLQKVVKPQELNKWSNGALTFDDFMEVDEPKKGEDCGDHPPIYPIKALDLADRRVTNQETELYEYVCRHFVATLMKPCKYETYSLKFSIGTEEFQTQVRRGLDPGYTKIMPWQSVAVDDDLFCSSFDNIMQLEQTFSISDMNMAKKKSSPPTHLTESELIAKMEQYAIGTDASIPTHVQNISDRGYVKISEGRKLVPTQLGIALVKAFRELDQDLVLPTVRAEVERSLSRIAKGEADHDTVRDEILNLYKEKFLKLTSRFYTVGHTFQGCFPPRGAYEPPALDHRPKAGSSKQNVSTGGSKRTKATSKSEIDNKRTKKIPSLMSVKPSAFASTCAQPYFNPRRPTNDTETNAANKRKLPAEAPSSNKRFKNFQM